MSLFYECLHQALSLHADGKDIRAGTRLDSEDEATRPMQTPHSSISMAVSIGATSIVHSVTALKYFR